MFVKSVNTAMIVGRTGTEPRAITAKTCTGCSFPVAVNESRRDADGMTVTVTTWINVTLWDKNAENAFLVLGKGDLVAVSGSLCNRERAVAGESLTTLEFRADRFELLCKCAPKGAEAAKVEDAPKDAPVSKSKAGKADAKAAL